MTVVDANVVVKWYVEEAGSLEAALLFETEDLLVAPGHVLGEVGEVLLRYHRGGLVSDAQLDVARVALPGALLLVPLDMLFDPAIEIAQRLKVSFYDALYVAAAEQWDTILVTADHRLADAAAASAHAARVATFADWSRGARH